MTDAGLKCMFCGRAEHATALETITIYPSRQRMLCRDERDCERVCRRADRRRRWLSEIAWAVLFAGFVVTVWAVTR